MYSLPSPFSLKSSFKVHIACPISLLIVPSFFNFIVNWIVESEHVLVGKGDCEFIGNFIVIAILRTSGKSHSIEEVVRSQSSF